MCGIAGLIHEDLPEPRLVMHAMLAAQEHRGPDDQGDCVLAWGDQRQVLLGHRRLAILDPTPLGRQPYVSPSGRYTLTYNGEIYNFREIHAALGNPSLPSSSDTAVIASALDHWGFEQTIAQCNGMFALGVWDKITETTFLVRDRFGQKPLYYGSQDNTFAFASELASLKQVPGLCQDICPEALEELIQFGYIAAPKSIYKNLNKLPPGHCLRITQGATTPFEVKVHRYWQPEPDSTADWSDDATFVAEMEELLRDSIQKRMISDVPLGAFLSGGIDSSLVCALMNEVANVPVKTFSIGFAEAEFDESKYARQVAQHLGTDHHELILGADEAMNLVEQMPRVFSEPFGDSSQIPTYLVSQFAREHVTVALSGDGGDELFSGYSRFAKVMHAWRRQGQLRGRVLTAGLNMANSVSPRLTERWLMRAFGRNGTGRAARKTVQRELERRNTSDFVRYYQLNNSAHAFADSFLADKFRVPEPPCQNLTGTGLQDWSQRCLLSLHDLTYYLPGDILTKVDRASMAVSLETRNPLLDFRLAGPALAALNRFESLHQDSPKWALKQILQKYVPPQYFERPKQGFAVPVGDWMAGPFRDRFAGLFADAARSLYFDEVRVGSAWQEFQAGDRLAWEVILWRIAMFMMWLEQE